MDNTGPANVSAEYLNILLEITKQLSAHETHALPTILHLVQRATHAGDACVVVSETESYATRDEGLTGYVLRRGPLEAATRAALPSGETAPERIRAMLVLSMSVRDTRYGLLAITYPDAHTFSSEERTFLSIVAGQTAVTLRNRLLQLNQSEFNSTVSHDLRSPLTYMQGFASMLPMVGEMNTKQQDHLDRIIGGIEQMTDLLDKVLDAGRLDPETGYYDLAREACDVADMARSVVKTYTPNAEKKNLKLTAVIDPDIPVLSLDAAMLRRALNNLVDNAIKYTPEGGSIMVNAHAEDGTLLLAVTDTGLGISEENQKILFNRFRRVRRKEHTKIKGIGLGLFIVKHVAQRHGGDAWVESREGQGSQFFIRIPLEGVNLIGAEARKVDQT
jgi:signal transduction histidine kinase